MSERAATLRGVAGYFLRLGATGFGGPVALANAIRRDLVEARGWLSVREYEAGLAIAAACPGPLAYQLGVYCGYIRFGIVGGLSVAIAFALAPFAIVLAAAVLYAHFAAAATLRALFYGVGPVVVALIFKASWQLGRRTLRKDGIAWAIATVAGLVTVMLERELVLLFLAAGMLGLLLYARGARAGAAALGIALPSLTTLGPPWLQLFLFFFKSGALIFGSGLVIVPFLRTYVVDEYHWITMRAFLDAVAIGLVSPGPVVITATFVGYLVDGLRGALFATLGIFTPAVLFTLLATPVLLRHGESPRLRGFIRGVTAAVVGVLLGTAVLVARSAIGDALTAALALVTLAALLSARAIPEPLLVAAGGLVGLVAYPLLQPAWLP